MTSWVIQTGSPETPPAAAETAVPDWLNRNYPERITIVDPPPPEPAPAFRPPAPPPAAAQPVIDDPVAIAADAAFAEAAARAAFADELKAVQGRRYTEPPERSTAADPWAPQLETTGQVIHALLGI